MRQLVIYVHGKGGCAGEAEHYRKFFPESDVIGFDYKSQNPWEAKKEFPAFFDSHAENHSSVVLIANSIGAFFSMSALSDKKISRAFFISPVVDMEKLICNMIAWAEVSEKELEEKREIPASFGETLSWEYLCYVRKNPLDWRIPTCILYGEKDNLTSLETIESFADKTKASLTVMKNGEHWFHTKEQMDFLDEWIKKSGSAEKRAAGQPDDSCLSENLAFEL